jgi:hypothetical protein
MQSLEFTQGSLNHRSLNREMGEWIQYLENIYVDYDWLIYRWKFVRYLQTTTLLIYIGTVNYLKPIERHNSTRDLRLEVVCLEEYYDDQNTARTG